LAVPVHAAISALWAIVFSRLLPRSWTVPAAVGAGGAVAALDLRVIGRHIRAIRELPQGPQIADHLLFGAIAGTVVAVRRERR